MNLYSRLIAALAIAASVGATCLVLVLWLQTGPLVTWAMLVGALIAGAVGLGHWVIRPIRKLAAELGDGTSPEIHDVLERIRRDHHALKIQVDDSDRTLAAEFDKRTRQWHQGNQALSLLFSSVTRDHLDNDHHAFFEPLLGDWTREGLVDAAAIIWNDDTPSSLHTGAGHDDLADHDGLADHGGPENTLTALPEAIEASAHHLTHSVMKEIDGRIWAIFPVTAPQSSGDATRPEALVVAWNDTGAPGEQTLAGWTAVAHYMGLRSQALAGVVMATAPAQDTDTLALQADFLADANGRLQKAMAAMGELTSLMGKYLEDRTPEDGEKGGASEDAISGALLDRGQTLLERLSRLLDLTTNAWRPAAHAPQQVDVATLVEHAVARHRSHPEATLSTQNTTATDPVETDPTALSLALDSLLKEMLQRHPGHITVTTRQHSDDGRMRGEFVIESDHPGPVSETTSLGLALATQLATARGGGVTQSRNDFSHHIRLSWPYTPNPFSRHGKAA